MLQRKKLKCKRNLLKRKLLPLLFKLNLIWLTQRMMKLLRLLQMLLNSRLENKQPLRKLLLRKLSKKDNKLLFKKEFKMPLMNSIENKKKKPTEKQQKKLKN